MTLGGAISGSPAFGFSYLRIPKTCLIIAVANQKGGVRKTTTAINRHFAGAVVADLLEVSSFADISIGKRVCICGQ